VAIPTELGPVEYIVVHFENAVFDGSGLAELVSLQDRGIIRVLDLMFVSRGEDGSIAWLDYDSAAESNVIDAGLITDDLMGILSEEDALALAEELQPGEALAILVFEDTWAVKLQERLGASGGRLIEASRIPKDAIDAALAYAAEEAEEIG
jgi:hypothetical protein